MSASKCRPAGVAQQVSPSRCRPAGVAQQVQKGARQSAQRNHNNMFQTPALFILFFTMQFDYTVLADGVAQQMWRSR